MPKFSAAASRAYIPSSFLTIDSVASSKTIAPISNNSARCTTAYSRDTSPHSQPEALGRSKRKHIPTKRALAGHIPEVAKSKKRSRAYRRTLELKKFRPSSRDQSLELSVGTQSHLDDNQIDSDSEVSTCDLEDRTTKPPTFISTYAEEDVQQVSNRQQVKSQIFRRFRQILQDSETPVLEGILGDLSDNSKDPLRAEESDTEVRVLSPIPIVIGGGFHLDYHPANRNEMNISTLPSLPNRRHSTHRMPSRPLADPSSPFIDRTETPSSTRPPQAVGSRANLSASPQAVDNTRSEGGQTEMEVPDDPMHRTEWGIPTSSQSLGGWAPDRPDSLRRALQGATSAQSNRSEHTQVEDQQEAQEEGQQEQTLDTQAPRQPRVRTSSPRATAHTSTRPVGSRSGPYRTRLNIVAISSSRGMAQPTRTTTGPIRPASGSIHDNSTSQPHPSQSVPALDPTPAIPYSPPQHRSLRNQSAQAPSLRLEPPPVLQDSADTDLLEDDEEERAIIRAIATSTIPLPKKRKPAMSDLDAEERQVVLVVRDLVLARSLQEGTFQTRGVYRQWFEESYAQVANLVYNGEIVPASDDMCTVTINNMSTSRGHINERERGVVQRFYEFIDPTDDEQCEANVANYAILWPNAFICSDPTNKTGHYESGVIGAGIAAGCFHTPTAVGVRYPRYFRAMDFPLVAFVLCSLQCCIGEWKEGYFEKKPISARYMLSLYVCHLQGLKEAEIKAPGRMAELRAKWYQDSLTASGALRPPKKKKFVQPITRREDVRPDSPHRRQRGVPRNATPGPGPITESHRATRYSPLPPRSPTAPLPGSRLRSPLSPSAEDRPAPSYAKGKDRAN